jgi:hypothetical protein
VDGKPIFHILVSGWLITLPGRLKQLFGVQFHAEGLWRLASPGPEALVEDLVKRPYMNVSVK